MVAVSVLLLALSCVLAGAGLAKDIGLTKDNGHLFLLAVISWAVGMVLAHSVVVAQERSKELRIEPECTILDNPIKSTTMYTWN